MIAIESEALHGAAAEVGGQTGEGPGVLVDDGHRVAGKFERACEFATDSPASDHDDVHRRLPRYGTRRDATTVTPGVAHRMACWRAPHGRPDLGRTMLDSLKRLFVGRPLATSEEEHQRLTKPVALAVFSSDAISSTAYATEEILFVTAVGAGTSLALGLDQLVPIAIGVAILIAIVVTSYRQTIYAYPKGGAAYVVSRENHGELPSLVAAASILVDYILTVAVSVSAGPPRIISIPQFHDTLIDHRVAICLTLIVLISLANLRGHQGVGPHVRVPDVRLHRHGGRADLLRPDQVVLRVVRRHLGHRPEHDPGLGGRRDQRWHDLAVPHPQGLLVGCGRTHRYRSDLRRCSRVPASGAEERGDDARGDGHDPRDAVPRRLGARESPRAGSRATTSPCSRRWATAVFGDGATLFILQILTAGILVLAANTAYADFPRLSSIVARDGYSAAPAREPGRPARLLERHRRPRAHGERADRRVRRRHQRPDPALRSRRVHLLHALAVGHGAPPPARATPALEAARGDQRHRRDRDVHRPHGRCHHEVRRRSVDPAHRHSRDRAAVQGDQAPLRLAWPPV